MNNAVLATSSDLTWRQALRSERQEPYFQEILAFIARERAAGKLIYPPDSEIFNALRFCELHQVRVVIIGQDPYHGAGQAHGLCFSVRPGVPHPPSLRNIFKERLSDIGAPIPESGSLEAWAHQGVLLLNTFLSVEEGRPQSHAQIGWERFTDRIISIVNEHCSGVVFLLWGAHAQRKGALIDSTRHHVLTAAHPSPFSADKGFFGCKHFSRANLFLAQQGQAPIAW